MVNTKTLRRFGRGSTDEERRNFGRDLLEALDLLGIGPGENFVVGHWPASEDTLPPPDRKALGAFQRESSTSRKAALDNYPRSGTQRERILKLVALHAEDGRTRDELCVALELDVSSVNPRISELKEGGWIEQDGDRTRKTRRGSEAAVMVLTDKALNHAIGVAT